MGLEGQKPAKNHHKMNHTLGHKHGCCIYAKLRKVQALYAKKCFIRASSDTYLKWLLGPDQDLVFTFSNPALKSALYLPGSDGLSRVHTHSTSLWCEWCLGEVEQKAIALLDSSSSYYEAASDRLSHSYGTLACFLQYCPVQSA